MTVLVLNSGSSSLKYQLVDPTSGEALAAGLVERIGQPVGRVKHEVSGEVTERDATVDDHGAALRLVLELSDDVGPSLAEAQVRAVGHRVVHGGPVFSAPTVIDDDVVDTIRELVPLAPLHNPANLTGIEVARELLDVPHVAVFDTAFFAALPAAAHTYAIDRQVAADHRVRRYGFHGTSHQYVSGQVAHLPDVVALLAEQGRDASDLRQVVLHLGNGASASAVSGGLAVDTSMGLTPLEGLVMGTRSGDLDPAITFHLMRTAGMSPDDVDDLLNKRSGIKGMSGVSDMRELAALREQGDPHAELAFAVYTHRLRKYVGAYAAVLGGIDVLTFTAGVGENDAAVRAAVTETLGFLGLSVDPERNARRSGAARVISPDGADALVAVVPTNEELAIARQSIAVLP